MPEKLFGKDFVLVAAGQIISLFGNAILRFALPLHILDISKSAAVFGMVSAASFLPMAIISPIGGFIADRTGKQRIMAVLDFITAALILMYILTNKYFSIMAATLAMLMALSAIQGIYTPAVQSSIPALVQTGGLVRANAVVNLVNSLAGMMGPVAGGVLYKAFGLSSILTAACACFAFSAVLELFIRIPGSKQETGGNILQIAKRDMLASFRFITGGKTILAKCIAVIFLFNAALTSMIIIGLPILITRNLGLDSRLYGIAQGLIAAGSIAGGVYAGMMGKRLVIQKVNLLLLFCSIAALPVGMVFVLNAPPTAAYIVITSACTMAFFAGTLFSIQVLAFIQAETPPEIIGKVMSLLITISLCAQPAGQMVFGMLFERFSAQPYIVIFISAFISGIIALYSKKQFGKTGA